MGASAEPATFVAILGAASTLAATLLGGGGAIVPMEDPIRESGYVLSPFLFLLGAAWTLYTSFLLLRVSAISGEASYEDIAEKTLGKRSAPTLCSPSSSSTRSSSACHYRACLSIFATGSSHSTLSAGLCWWALEA